MSRAVAAALTIAMLVSPSGPPLTAQAPGPDAYITSSDLGNGVYLFRASDDYEIWTYTNTVVIVGRDGVVVFDSNTRPSTAQAIVARIRRLTDQPVRFLINSHWHKDHWGGNEVYAREFPGIQIVATAETREYMKLAGPVFRTELAAADRSRMQAVLDSAIRSGTGTDGKPFTAEARRRAETELANMNGYAAEMANVTRVLPTLVFRDSLTFWSGGREFRLSSETGDATGSAVLYLPEEQLLVTGDLLVYPTTWTTNSYKITPWVRSLRGLAALDLKTIVPGHGEALHDKVYLTLIADFFEAVVTQTREALASGIVKVDDVKRFLKLDAIRARYAHGDPAIEASFERTLTNLVQRAYREAADGVLRQ